MKVYLSNPRGFCAGVDRAIDIVEKALEIYGAPIYVRHEVVHNKLVVNNLRDKGAIFVEELDEVPPNQTVIFSAHGVSKAVRQQATELQLKTIDATCPLVTKVHTETQNLYKKDINIVMIGHKGHPEVEGTMGQVDKNMFLVENEEDIKALPLTLEDDISYVTQTTLSMDDTAEIVSLLTKHYPQVKGPKKQDICYATQNRQDAVKSLAEHCDIFLIVGSQNSSNTNRLKEVALKFGIPAYRIENADDLDLTVLEGKSNIGITAGASAPETLVQEVVSKISNNFGTVEIEEVNGVKEDTYFPRPKELKV